MADAVGARFEGVEVELIEGSGGAFEVKRDGKLIFSKFQADRFPEDAEIFEALEG